MSNDNKDQTSKLTEPVKRGAKEDGLLDAIRHRYVDSLCVSDPGFWAARQDAKFATLLALSHVRSIPALPVSKRDRRGWVVGRFRPLKRTLRIVAQHLV